MKILLDNGHGENTQVNVHHFGRMVANYLNGPILVK